MARQTLSTLFLLITILALLVEGTQIHNNNHARFIRKRATTAPAADAGAPAPAPILSVPPIIGAGADPNQKGTALNTATGTGSIVATQTGTSAAGQPSGGLLGNLTGIVGSVLTGGSSSTASSSSVSSSSLSSSSVSSSSIAPLSASTPVTTATFTPPVSSVPDSVVTRTSGIDAPASSATSTNATANEAAANIGSNTKLARTTIIVIASVAGSIALIAIVWTIIRKWKFRPSDDFEERLNPISWDPTVDTSGPGMLQRTSSRGSVGNRSFVSAGQVPAPSLISDLPNHDFTAGSGRSGLAPVGGYADMRRGPSPTPGALIPGSMESVMRNGQGGGAYDYGRQYNGGGY